MDTIATRRPARQRAALGTVLAVLFLTFLDTTIVSVTLGNIQYHLGSGVIPLQWVVNAYSLVFASLMLLAGSLSDRFGRKTFMVAGIVVFCVGSLVCALAPSVGWVIGGRAVMGVGAAASEPGTLSVIRQLFPDRRERARALGAWAAVSGLALALGPVLGGVLIAIGDWRDVFWFNLAVGAVLLVRRRPLRAEQRRPAGRPGRRRRLRARHRRAEQLDLRRHLRRAVRLPDVVDRQPLRAQRAGVHRASSWSSGARGTRCSTSPTCATRRWAARCSSRSRCTSASSRSSS